MVAHVLMEEIATTFGLQGTKNVAKVIENRRIHDSKGLWPDTALGIVSQGNPDKNVYAFVAWKEPSSRGRTEWSSIHWETACGVAHDLVNKTPISGFEPKMANCKWYHSCRTDRGWEPVDTDFVHSETDPKVGTVYYYEHAFETDAKGWNCWQKAP
jgi:hypothetical protein